MRHTSDVTILNMTRYWDPMTASIDWCEKNYEVSEYVVEFWNALSSLAFSAVGLLNLWVLRNLKGEVIERFIAVLFITVGLGSAAFHGTLKYENQMYDEVPMMWVAGAAIYCYLTLEDKIWIRRKELALFFVLYTFLWTLVHSFNSFVLVFQVNFGFMLTVNFLCMFYFQYKFGNKTTLMMLKVYFACQIVAFMCFLADIHFCEYFTVVNPQFHSWWHMFMSCCCHYSLMFEVMLRRAKHGKMKLTLEGCILKCPTLKQAA